MEFTIRKYICALVLLFQVFGVTSLYSADYEPPVGYYNSVSGLTGSDLEVALHEIIDDHFVASYNIVKAAISELDRDPQNPNNILLLYSGDSVPHSATSWNREHTWPRSFGAESGPAYSDAHHLFPADAGANSDRSNYAFDELTIYGQLVNAPDSKINDTLRMVEPRDEDKGRIARCLFYMATRYDSDNVTGDFTLSDDPQSYAERMGKLSALLKWNREFPPDEREKRRNQLIYDGFVANNVAFFQTNRNPYVDYPELVDAVFTGDLYASWNAWRVMHFALSDLNDLAVTGSLIDLDVDGLTNLMEFALQTNPDEFTLDNLPSTDRGEGVNYFLFNRIKQPDQSDLQYNIEYSTFPLETDSWQDIPFTSRDLLLSDRGLYELASLGHDPGETSRLPYYRLVVTRTTQPEGVVEGIFDQALHESGDLNLFTYTEEGAGGWRHSDWFGEVKYDNAPWFEHGDHGWIHSEAISEEAVWFYDTSIGWFYTGIGFYPYVFSSNFGWIYHVETSQSPNRWFYSLETGQFIFEPNLLQNP